MLADLVSEGADVTVKPVIRDIVEAVRRFNANKNNTVFCLQCDLVEKLGKDKSTISRQVGEAVAKGYLRRDGVVLLVGDPLPNGTGILPTVDDLVAELHGVA
jgi:hypothetical protein